MDKNHAPVDGLLRGVMPFEFRADGDAMPTLVTRFAVFDRWTEINSWFEGRFLERIAPGAFAKTIRESRDNIKVLYDHGMDFEIGNKVLGRIEELREEPSGPWAEVPLFDTSYNRDLIPGLEAGVYGASFRFRVVKEEWSVEPDHSDDNPEGLPERTIKEVRLYEFGPVTFPAYPEATAGLRSITDAWLARMAERNPDRFAAVLQEHPEAAARYYDLRTRAWGAADGTPNERAAHRNTDEPASATRRAVEIRQRLRRWDLRLKGDAA